MRALAALVGLVGCSGEEVPPEPRTEAALVDMTAWARGEAAVWPDPLPDHYPPEADCPAGGALAESGTFEVRTGVCTRGWFQQPALADLIPGDEVELVFWHLALVSEVAGEQGHVALFVGDALLYEHHVDIPSDPVAYTEQVAVGFAAEAGDVVTLHLHNHGANDWNVLRVDRLGDE